ncbi:MAG: hypothetical protein J6A83_02865 [Clostridia bacterium]|nr:hypothetical protein [Clostridia bacterium]
MKTVIVDNRIPQKCADALTDFGFSIIRLPSFSALPQPVSAHPDMLLFFAKDTVLCHREYAEIAAREIEQISAAGYRISVSDEKISDSYPEDILFNALSLGGKIYCKADSVSGLIIDFARENGIEIRNVKQGYAKCSVCAVSDNAAITSDTGLCKAMREDGVDVLLISAGSISLSGYDTGFIGGCSGSDGERIYFSGNIALHPNGKAIAEFCEKHSKKAVSLSAEPLYDVGNMFFI